MSIEVHKSFCHSNSNFLIEQFLQEIKTSQENQKFDKFFLPNETFLDKKNTKNPPPLKTSTDVKSYYIYIFILFLMLLYVLSVMN